MATLVLEPFGLVRVEAREEKGGSEGLRTSGLCIGMRNWVQGFGMKDVDLKGPFEFRDLQSIRNIRRSSCSRVQPGADLTLEP